MPFRNLELRYSRRIAQMLSDLCAVEVEAIQACARGLVGDISNFLMQNPDAETIIANADAFVFVCRKSSHLADVWLVVRIYNDEPHDTPPGGGLGAVRLHENTCAGDMNPMPTAIRWVVDNAPQLQITKPVESQLDPKQYFYEQSKRPLDTKFSITISQIEFSNNNPNQSKPSCRPIRKFTVSLGGLTAPFLTLAWLDIGGSQKSCEPPLPSDLN